MKIEIEIQPQRVNDLLINAIAHGISYWCKRCTSNEDVTKLKDEPDTFIEFDENTGKETEHTLTYEKVEKGLKLMIETAPHNFAAFLSETDDASDADVFIQLCLFGDIVYG